MAANLMLKTLFPCPSLDLEGCFSHSFHIAGQGQAIWDRIQPEPIRNITPPNVFDGAATHTYHPQIVKNNTSQITTFSFNSFST